MHEITDEKGIYLCYSKADNVNDALDDFKSYIERMIDSDYPEEVKYLIWDIDRVQKRNEETKEWKSVKYIATLKYKQKETEKIVKIKTFYLVFKRNNKDAV